MLTVANYQEAPATGLTAADIEVSGDPLTEQWAEVQEKTKGLKDIVKWVTVEDLKDLKAATEFFNRDTRTVLERWGENSKAVVIDVQEMMIHLWKDLGTFWPKGNGVDGGYGKTMVRVVTEFQAENWLAQDGKIWKLTYAKILEKVQALWGMSEKKVDNEIARAERKNLANQTIIAADQTVDNVHEMNALIEQWRDWVPHSDQFNRIIEDWLADANRMDELSQRLTKEISESDTPDTEQVDQVKENIQEGKEFEIAVPEQSEINDYSRKDISKMTKYEREAVQRDVNSVLAGMGETLMKVDGGIGSISREKMAKIGVYNTETKEVYLVKLVRLAQIARNGAQFETSNEAANDYKELKTKADQVLSVFAPDMEESEFQEGMKVLAELTDVPDNDGDGKDDWTEANKTRRLVMAQYITDSAARRVDTGEITNIQASNIVERLLAQQKFESKPGRDSISRMVKNTFADIKAITRNEQGQELAASFNSGAAINAIVRSNEPMSMWTSLERGYFRVAGQNYDIDRAEDMYCVTGNGIQRISMRDTAAFDLMDVAVVGNTIVGMIENGCEGNVIYIPLDVNTVPKPPRRQTTKTPRKYTPERSTPKTSSKQPKVNTPTPVVIDLTPSCDRILIPGTNAYQYPDGCGPTPLIPGNPGTPGNVNASTPSIWWITWATGVSDSF